MDVARGSADLVALVRRARDGDDQALEKLLVVAHVHILRYFRAWLFQRRGSEDEALDLAQDTLIRIVRSLGDCTASTDAQFITWCRTLAANIGIDYLRAMREEWESMTFRGDLAGIRAVDWDWRECEIDEASGASIMLRLLREVHASEAEETQGLLWHRLVQEDQWAAAGGVLGIPRTAAKRRFQRAQKRLRHALLAKLIDLPADELTTVRRWMARFEMYPDGEFAVSLTQCESRPDA